MVRRHLERPPTKRDMTRYPSRIGAQTYVQRFGSWAAALEALARRAVLAPDDHAGRRAARIAWERPRLRAESVALPPATDGQDARPYVIPPPERLAELNVLARLGTRPSLFSDRHGRA